MVSASLFFKCENFQRSGSFKLRGASNAILSLPETELHRGVATHSSGNHAGAVALTAMKRGIDAFIVMPKNAKRAKIEAVKGYGAELFLCEPTLRGREESLERVVARTQAQVIHPYDDLKIIEGQATVGLELLQQVPKLDAVLVPVGGGGLLSGTALAVHYLEPEIDVVGVEPEGADDAYRSFRDGVRYESVNPTTLADGLLTSLGRAAFPIIREYVRRIVTVSDEHIVAAMRLVWERMKIIVEPSGAVPFAAVLAQAIDVKGKRIGVVLSGGNVDLDHLPWQS
jgi:threonine dehydratase